MKLPLKVVRQYTKLNIPDEEVISMISHKIGEVEYSIDWSKAYEGIYIAEIVEKSDHPDADKLGIYMIDIRENENIQVVAGDKELNVGDKVAYIKPGNIVPSTYYTDEKIKIRAANMRGILSNGMLCSQKELNIGNDHTHVYKLPSDAPVGEMFSDYFELNDTVVEIENKALTNRGDLFGILGLSRELSAGQQIPFKSPDWYKVDHLDISPSNTCLPISVSNEAETICPRYMCIAIDNVNISESPIWLKSILIKSGIKPINNVVDITNYLMVLTAQPLHAFDYDKVVKGDVNSTNEAKITVRLARDEENIQTLDGKVVQLNSNTLVIADSTNPIAIAGIMGGLDTEIDENTKRVIIECANFDRYSIRKSSMALGIVTDASTRYTRAQDPNQCLPVLGKCIELITSICGGNVSSNVIDNYPLEYKPDMVTLSLNRLNTHLGTDLSRDELITILENLEYTILPSDGLNDYITVVVPLGRRDISIPEDIHEDIARIYGYENIPIVLPLRDLKPSKKNNNLEIKSRIRNILSNSGCNEVDTYNFISKDVLEKCNLDVNLAYHIKNALSPDLAFMRTNILVSLLEKSSINFRKNISTFSMYEFNIPHQKGYMDNFELPNEDWHLAFTFISKDGVLDGNPYYEAKVYLGKILNTLGIHGVEYELIQDSSEADLDIWVKDSINMFNRNSASILRVKGYTHTLGIIGEIESSVKDNLKLPKYSCGFEINLEVLKKLIRLKKPSNFDSKYPKITKDYTFVLPNEKKYSELEEEILKKFNKEKYKVSIECLDIYQKAEDTKSITIRVSAEHKDKTLRVEDLPIKEQL